jgi:hypothetical protein
MTIPTPSLESMIGEFRTRCGLYVLGAGASAGISPVGDELAKSTGVDFIRRGGFSVMTARPTILTNRVAAKVMSAPASSLVYPDRILRPGTQDFPYAAALARLTDEEAQVRMRIRLASFERRPFDNYRVFRLFYPSLILNYNLDGVARDLCGDRHQFLTPHGTIARGFRPVGAAKVLADVRWSSWPQLIDDVLMCIPEAAGDEPAIKGAWIEAAKSKPDFIAIIGYSFGRDGNSLDDHLSFEYFHDVFEGFAGNVYVIDPAPDFLSGLIADAIKSRRVCAMRALWNVLAHAVSEQGSQSLDHVCNEIRAGHGDWAAFPAPHDH